MALSWASIKHLMRLLGVAEQLTLSARDVAGVPATRDFGRALGVMLDQLIEEVDSALGDTGPDLAEELGRIAGRNQRMPLPVRAALVTGWLKGAVEAETLEVRIRIGEDRARPRKVHATGAGNG